jgi:hypothetical protein
MAFPRRVPADGVAAALLLSAAVVLVATPYDGGSCQNVAAAYALPAASLAPAEQPAEPASLTEARAALASAQSDSDGLADEQTSVDRAQQAATDARAVADKADMDQYSTDYSTDDYAVSSAQSDVDSAQSAVDSAQSWLETVQQYVADPSNDGIWTQQDLQDAQSEVDDANAQLTEAQQALQETQARAAASESAAAAAKQKAERLDAAADAAEQAAGKAADDLAEKQSEVQAELYLARSQVSQEEADYRSTVADWAHQRRVAGDHIAALNNVRASCRQNGTWRAAVAGADVVLLAALGLRRWAPRPGRWGPRLRRMRERSARISLPRPWRRP